ncbi:MAG: exodeoxyribonuclease V subunit gamma [Sandaracinaceae bacterium]|nr:exodeoxyribonuclease V subunit gamma [Sandaracinaceae bacterium]
MSALQRSIFFYQAPTTEALLRLLLEKLQALGRGSVFAPVYIVVPNQMFARLIENEGARASRSGCVANLRFLLLDEWLSLTVLRLGPSILHKLRSHQIETAFLAMHLTPKDWCRLILREVLKGDLFEQLNPTPFDSPASQSPTQRDQTSDFPFTNNPKDPSQGQRLVELARTISTLFFEYVRTRCDWVECWKRGQLVNLEGQSEQWHHNQKWQAALFHRIITNYQNPSPPSLPQPTYHLIFGFSHFTPLAMKLIHAISEFELVLVFSFNPSKELWFESKTSENEPQNPILHNLGQAGKYHIQQAAKLVDHDFEFLTSSLSTLPATSALQHLQREIIEDRTPSPCHPDTSLVLLECPNLRREVEAVILAAASMVAASDAMAQKTQKEALRWNEILFIYPSQVGARYLLEIEHVIESMQLRLGSLTIPWSTHSALRAPRNRVIDGAIRLIEFFAHKPTRKSLLTLARHPLLSPALSVEHKRVSHDNELWTELCVKASIIRGIDASDLENSYVEEEIKHKGIHFDQGVHRLALAMAYPPNATVEPDNIGSTDPHIPIGDSNATLEFITWVRSLLSDHQHLNIHQCPLSEWGTIFQSLLQSYLHPSNRDEHTELMHCVEIIKETLGTQNSPGADAVVPASISLHLVLNALLDQRTVIGQPQSRGALVGSLLELRGLPCRVAFLMGMSEFHFPSDTNHSRLDLRRDAPLPSDLRLEERERYALLELLHQAKDRVWFSYVSQDEQSGDLVEPSPIIRDLERALGSMTKLEIQESEDWLKAQSSDFCKLITDDPIALPLVEKTVITLSSSPKKVANERPQYDVGQEQKTTCASPITRKGLGINIRIDTLRLFLKCPIQGQASQWIRFPHDYKKAEIERERLLIYKFTQHQIAFEALLACLASPSQNGDWQKTVDEWVRKLISEKKRNGEFPLGMLGDELVPQIKEQALVWLEQILHCTTDAKLQLMHLGNVHQPRIPRKADKRPPLILPLPSPTDSPAIRIEGSLSPLLVGRNGEFLVYLMSGKERERLFSTQLDAFLDHALLCAMGESHERRLITLHPDLKPNTTPEPTTYPKIDSQEARAWLSSLAFELSAPEIKEEFFVADCLLDSEPPSVLGPNQASSVQTQCLEWASRCEEVLNQCHAEFKDKAESSPPSLPDHVRFGPLRPRVVLNYSPPSRERLAEILEKRFWFVAPKSTSHFSQAPL